MSTEPQSLSEQLSLRLSADQRAHIRTKVDGLNKKRFAKESPFIQPQPILTESDYIRHLIDCDRLQDLRAEQFQDRLETKK